MPQKGKPKPPKVGLSGPNTPGQTVRVNQCECTPETTVQDLCNICELQRRRILDRARRRRNRGGAEGGGTQLSSTETAHLLNILDTIKDHQIALEDRARLTGKPLTPGLTNLLTELARLRDALRPALNARGEEQIEIDRPGGSPRIGTRRPR